MNEDADDVVVSVPLGAYKQWTSWVSLDGSPQVRVRFADYVHGPRWRCDSCGNGREPNCEHARAASKAVFGPMRKGNGRNNNGN